MTFDRHQWAVEEYEDVVDLLDRRVAPDVQATMLFCYVLNYFPHLNGVGSFAHWDRVSREIVGQITTAFRAGRPITDGPPDDALVSVRVARGTAGLKECIIKIADDGLADDYELHDTVVNGRGDLLYIFRSSYHGFH